MSDYLVLYLEYTGQSFGWEWLKEVKPLGVFHSFSEAMKLAEDYIKDCQEKKTHDTTFKPYGSDEALKFNFQWFDGEDAGRGFARFYGVDESDLFVGEEGESEDGSMALELGIAGIGILRLRRKNGNLYEVPENA